MTPVTFVFLTLFIWVVSCSTWHILDQCAELIQNYEETKAFPASCKNVAIYDTDNSKLTQTRERAFEMNVGSDNIFTQERIAKEFTLCAPLPLNCMVSNGCVNVPQEYKDTVKADEGSRHVCKCKTLQFLVYFLFKTNCVLHMMEMPSKVYSTHCPKEVFATPADGIRVTVCTSKIVQSTDSSRWVGRIFQAALLIFAIYMANIKISSNRVSLHHNCNFLPSFSIYQPPEWRVIAVYVSCVVGRTVHVLIIFRAAHAFMKWIFPAQHRLRALPVAVLLIWLIFIVLFLNNNMKDLLKDLLIGGLCGVLSHVALPGTLLCVLLSYPTLLQSILSKINFLNVLFYVQLVTCQQNSRIPTKYVLIVKLGRLM